ncbi:MAG: hypothetical protein ACK5LX_04295 [Oscillospiraceae bacterium]
MKLSDLWTPRKRVKAVQTAASEHPFAGWMHYQPLAPPELGLYAAIREGVPLVDAALDKIVRLTGGFQVICTDSRRQRELDDFVEHVKVGASSEGLRQFVSVYLDSLLTFGNAVGRLCPAGTGGTYTRCTTPSWSICTFGGGKIRWRWRCSPAGMDFPTSRCDGRTWCCLRR